MKIAGSNNRVSVVLTCEHASKSLPAAYEEQLRARAWQDHELYDPGASELARYLQKHLGCPLLMGEWSRILIDLNRSVHHAKLSKLLTGHDKEDLNLLIKQYYQPFRQAVAKEVRARRPCLHIGVHSFTRVMAGQVRAIDVGILYDPGVAWERDLAKAWLRVLRQKGLRAYANRPYKGTSDGHTTELRRLLGGHDYAGLELEVCSDLLVGDRASGMWGLILDSLRTSLPFLGWADS